MLAAARLPRLSETIGEEDSVRYGVSVPNFGVGVDARAITELAREAEEAGWDGFFLWDHLLAFSPGSVPVVDPWVALTAVALSTSRLRLGPMVTPLPRRRPVKLARETVSLDHLSGGRLILGVGIGAHALRMELPRRGAGRAGAGCHARQGARGARGPVEWRTLRPPRGTLQGRRRSARAGLAGYLLSSATATATRSDLGRGHLGRKGPLSPRRALGRGVPNEG